MKIKGNKLVELQKNKNGGVNEKVICNYVEITEVYRDHETGHLHVDLGFDNIYGERIQKIIPLGELNAKGLAAFEGLGFDLPKGKESQDLVDYLKQQVRSKEPKNRHEIVGYGQHEKKIFKCVDHIGDQQSKYVGHIDVNPKGDSAEYLRFVQEEILPYPKLAIILATSLAAPLLNKLSELVQMESILVNICGNSSTGKTTSSMVATSLFGNPNPESENTLSFSFVSTFNYIHETMGKYFNGIPCTIDEMGASELFGRNFTEYIYRLANGTTRGRLDKDYKPTKVNSYKTVIFMNGEFRLIDKIDSSAVGANIRILTFDSEKFFEDAHHCERVKQFVSNCYGHLGYEFVDFVDSIDPTNLKEIYEDCRNELEAAILDDVGFKLSSRIASKFSPITCALVLFLNMIGEIDEYQLYPEAHNFLANMITKHSSQYNAEHSLVLGIVDYLNNHPEKLLNKNSEPKDLDTLICVDQKGELIFKKEGFRDMLGEIDSMNYMDALKFFKSKDILIVNKDGERDVFDAKRVMFGKKDERVIVFNKKKFKELFQAVEEREAKRNAVVEDESSI